MVGIIKEFPVVNSWFETLYACIETFRDIVGNHIFSKKEIAEIRKMAERKGHHLGQLIKIAAFEYTGLST